MISSQTALITGAASGIGEAFSIELAKQGYVLVLVDKNTERLYKVADHITHTHQVTVYPCTADLADIHAPQAIFDFTQGQNLHIDFLVNNAGYSVPEYLLEKPWETHRDVIQVMATSVVHLTYLY